MIEQISYLRPGSIPRAGELRIQVEAVRNPILKELARVYNESVGTFNTPNVYAHNKGSHTKHSKGSSGGPCYLTTTCTSARGLSDNCLELTTLRAFRDQILIPSRTGRELVREYYELAPQIVEAVNTSGNSQSVWNDVYSDIQRIVGLVKGSKFNEAFNNYRRMTTALKEKYLC
ncbi:MAG: CFI-box-CTERM domain-containing protein [Nanoarchaeota archaeon]|nr:CFI-box-CTERM domain-containing protein [Nanoarchaeota archaeon]